MKKIMLSVMILAITLTSGCQKASDLLAPSPSPTPTPTMPVETFVPGNPGNQDEPSNEIKTHIPISQTLKMTNEWTIMGDFDVALTGGRTKDRVVLGTSAQMRNGEMMWDDSQYWTIAVLNENGAYNLFSQRMSGQVYLEVSEGYINGFSTPIVTAYIFSGTDREIRNYVFTDGVFEETIVYATKDFSTGGVNCMYTTIPENQPK